MYSAEQMRRAIETYIRFDYSVADTIAELGYPDRSSIYNWWKAYKAQGEASFGKKDRKKRYSEEQKRAAVAYYLEHGKSLARTIRAIGYPSSALLCHWIDELAPSQRKI